MIEDVDIGFCFQDPVDEPGFGHQEGKTDEKGEDQSNIAEWGETFHSHISQISQSARDERVSILPGSEREEN